MKDKNPLKTLEMKTVIILMFSVVFCLFANQAKANNNDQAFLESFRQTVKFNANRFQNINLVYPGDTVMIVKNGIIPMAILPKDSMPGYNDCIWYAVKRTFKEEASMKKPPVVYNKSEKIKDFNLSDFINKYLAEIIVSFLAGIFLLLLALLIIVALRRPMVINNNLSCRHEYPPTTTPV